MSKFLKKIYTKNKNKIEKGYKLFLSFIFMEQKEKLIKVYQEEVANVFDSKRDKYKFQKYRHKIESSFLKKTLEKIGKNSKIKVLDVACGTGRMLETVKNANQSLEYYGLDTSKSLTKKLKEKAKKIDIKVNIKLGDATEIPFDDNTFDLVYTYHLTWHLPPKIQKKIILEMLRVVKKEGYIVFDILNSTFLWEKIKIMFKLKKTEGMYKMSVSEVKNFLSDSDYTLEKLLDFPIKNSIIYSIFNLINKFRKVLPLSLSHMIFFRVKK